MKMLFVFILLLAVVPNQVCGGGFTADKRVYVTNEQWATEPYRYLLAKYVEEDGIEKNRCTANMVCGKIVTARHCIHDDCHNSNEIHMFKAYDGTKLQAKCENMGDYVLDQIGAKEGKNGDWAILEPIDEHKQFVVDNSICNFPSHTAGSSGRVYAAGFGGLKIMSDAEIESLRRAYVYFLENHIEYESGLKRVATISAAKNEEEGLYLEDGKNSTAFIYDLWCDHYGWPAGTKLNTGWICTGTNYKEMFDGVSVMWLSDDTDKMKSSKCAYSYKDMTSDGLYVDMDCQIWGGNSGGGVYLPGKKSYFVAIQTMGPGYIGGKNHASAGATTFVASDVFKSKLEE
ncbi:MAG: hypothetical protein IKK76_01000 [Alphaproteobacteria bacterium]|nr:hypothetical protein [Alphaproteobacteria bacterium]